MPLKLYNKEEKKILKKWGAKAELEFDTMRTLISPVTGKIITALEAAKARKLARREIGQLKRYKSV